MRKRIPLAGRACLCVASLAALFCIPHLTQAESFEEDIQSFFKDTPIMTEIARCESKFRQFDSDGLPLRGGWGGGMIGVFQIYESVHSTAAKSLGFDIATLEGNLGYAQHLYATQGTAPWNSAKACWEKAQITQDDSVADADIEELQEKIKTLKKLVAELQKLLAEKNVV